MVQFWLISGSNLLFIDLLIIYLIFLYRALGGLSGDPVRWIAGRRKPSPGIRRMSGDVTRKIDSHGKLR